METIINYSFAQRAIFRRICNKLRKKVFMATQYGDSLYDDYSDWTEYVEHYDDYHDYLDGETYLDNVQ